MTHRTWLVPAILMAALGLLSFSTFAADEPKLDVDKEFGVKKVNLTDQMSLGDALSKLKEQTGFEVEDRSESGDLRLKLNIKDATFWQALEAIAKEADIRVAPVVGEKKAGLVPGPYKATPVFFQGPFRAAVKKITASRDLETDAHVTTVNIEIAWLPGIRPFFQDAVPPDLEVTDHAGRLLKLEDEGMGRLPVTSRTAEVNLRLTDVPRTTPRLGSIKGTINLTGPTKWLEFKFDDLAKAKANPKDAEKEIEGVTAKLSNLDFGKDLWGIEITMNYPGTGLKLESFEVGDFVVFNQCRIIKDGKQVEDVGYETTGGSGSKTVVSYKFDAVGNQEKCGLIYRAPGPMKEIPVRFEFKDLVLP